MTESRPRWPRDSPRQIVGETRLVAVRRNAAGTFSLTFQNGAATFDVTANKVVFALPFSMLRESVDLTQADFSDLKMTAIRELAMGTNSETQHPVQPPSLEHAWSQR